MNESFISDEERMVIEAKIEVLQEAVSGAIIAAVVAVLGAIIALLIKFSGMLKEGFGKLKTKMKGKPKESVSLTEEQKNELEKRISDLVDGLNFKSPNKDKLKRFSDADIVNDENFKEIEFLTQFLPELSKEVVSIIDISGVDAMAEKVKPVLVDIKNHSKEVQVAKDAMEQTNIFFEVFAETAKTNPTDSISVCKKFLDGGYFDKATKMQDGMNKKASEAKKIIEQNQKKILVKIHPDQHIDESEKYNELSKNVSYAFNSIKEIANVIKTAMTQWVAAEKFRLSYCNICISYI